MYDQGVNFWHQRQKDHDESYSKVFWLPLPPLLWLFQQAPNRLLLSFKLSHFNNILEYASLSVSPSVTNVHDMVSCHLENP